MWAYWYAAPSMMLQTNRRERVMKKVLGTLALLTPPRADRPKRYPSRRKWVPFSVTAETWAEECRAAGIDRLTPG